MTVALRDLRRKTLNATIGARSKAARWLLGGYASQSYAQEGEDLVLRRLLERESPGFYVDVGAHDPRRYSNTYLLYLAGWHGIAIDPMPDAAVAFARVRPRDVFISAAVALAAGEMKYYEFSDPALNTLSAERADEIAAARDYQFIGSRSVPVTRLETVLDQHLPASSRFDVLSVDVEGFDEQVLSSNDWDRYRPRYVVAEVLNLEGTEGIGSTATGRTMAEAGYRPFAKAFNSVVFVPNVSNEGRSQ